MEWVLAVTLIALWNLHGAKHQVDARIKSKFTCQNKIMSIVCWPKVIKIFAAEYSRKQVVICSQNKDGLNSAVNCDPVNKKRVATDLCGGKVMCNITVNATTMDDHCPTVFKYLNVIYSCVKPPPTIEPTYTQNKSTMVLTKPPAPSRKPIVRVNNGILSSESPTTQDDFDEEYYSGDAGFILYDAACTNTNSVFLVVLLTWIILL